jgi:hypothetical protein
VGNSKEYEMTKAQWKVKIEQASADANYERRNFRKKCVTLGIVEFVKEDGHIFYEMKYRGCFICTMFNDGTEGLKLCAVWNTIAIAEETIEKIEGVKHESN